MARIRTAVVLSGAAIWWLWFALGHDGIVWPDEIYQSLEQGHRLAFGYGFVPWEFQLGARSWLFPAILAGVLKLGSWAGLETAGQLVACAKGFMVLLSLAALLATMRLAFSLGGERAALLAGVLGATTPAVVLFSGRCLTEIPSAVMIGFAVDLALRRGPRHLWWAGVLAGFATLFRVQNWIVVLGLAGWLIHARSWREARPYLAAAGMVALAGGAVDWMIWGAPFHSAVTYLRHNLVGGHASEYGIFPITFYATVLWTSTGLAVLFIGTGLARPVRRARGLLAVLGAYVLVHSLLPHKELRFLLPIAPLVFALAGAGLDGWLWQVSTAVPRISPRALGWGLGAMLAALMMIRVPALTFASIGRSPSEPGVGDSAWQRAESFNRLLLVAGRRDDLCGVLVIGPSIIWLGGYSYLHRDVPLLDLSPHDLARGWPGEPMGANYVIAPPSLAPAPPVRVQEVARSGGLALMRLDGPCGAPPPWYSRQLAIPAQLRP